jgi:hypothetical protein
MGLKAKNHPPLKMARWFCYYRKHRLYKAGKFSRKPNSFLLNDSKGKLGSQAAKGFSPDTCY